MAYAPRLLAPVAAPPPPKPPQLNLVASSLMPDVQTDTFGPGAAPALAAAGWGTSTDTDGRVMWHRPAGDETWAKRMIQRNALVASVGVMSDMELKQAETELGIDPESLPGSLYPTTTAVGAGGRWVGGFAWAPENQYPGWLADPCGTIVDLPYLSQTTLAAPATPTATPSITGGSLTNAHGAYGYVVVAIGPNGGQGTPTARFTGTIASGINGSNALAWTAVTGAAGYNVYRGTTTTYELIAAVTGTSFTDTGAAGPTIQLQSGNLPQIGYIPFMIIVEDTASAFGWEARDFTGRALRLLDNATPNAIEREFWTGTFATNTVTGPIYQSDSGCAGLNAFLQQSGTASNGGSGTLAQDLTPTPGTGVSVTRGIQILEDYLANTGFGGQGMLHVAPETSPNLLGARRVGAILLSVMDNIIVPGSGYPTTGVTGPAGNTYATPPAGTQWIYATDLVSIRLDDPAVYPLNMAEALDRGSNGEPNTIRIRAQRAAAATFDVNRLAAVLVTLST